jgi:hypothetical protein
MSWRRGKKMIHLLDDDIEIMFKNPIEAVTKVTMNQLNFRFNYNYMTRRLRFFDKISEGDYEITYLINIREERKEKLIKINGNQQRNSNSEMETSS